jgi:excisionase family DNA binding protein
MAAISLRKGHPMTTFELIRGEQLLKAEEIARMLNISRAMAYRLLRRGEIPVIRISRSVRVKFSDLQEYAKRSRLGSEA